MFGLVVAPSANLGDDIQSLAAKQYLPELDVYLNREFLDRVKSSKPIKTIMNGWFMQLPENFPPSQYICPFFVAFHISPFATKKILNNKGIDYLKKFEPIGARDLYTQQILKKHGIDSYFSGCLTLTLDYKFKPSKPSKEILIIDLNSEAFSTLPVEIFENARILSNNFFNSSLSLSLTGKIPAFIKEKLNKTNLSHKIYSFRYRYEILKKTKEIAITHRLKKAEERIRTIANSKLIITSRLHAALPAAAFGVPVIFVNENLNDPRFEGLLQFVNSYSVRNFKKDIHNINFDNPPKNPNIVNLMQIKQKLIRDVKRFIDS